MEELQLKGQSAKEAGRILLTASKKKKNEALEEIAKQLEKSVSYILEENKKDVRQAQKKGISESLLDRLMLTEDRIYGIAEGVRQVSKLKDPIGEVVSMWESEAGLRIGKKRVPMGVIGIIYEARPNVTVDAAVLCLKTSNATILRGGTEAFYSNLALVNIMKNTLESCGLPGSAIEMIEDTRRETAVEFMKLNDYLDVLIPRGGAGLIQTVVRNATVPVIETGTGNCHIFVDETADQKKAVDIIVNAKTQRPAVCNACESVLVHKNIAQEFLKMLAAVLTEKGVEIYGCEHTKEILPNAFLATEEDYATEYLDLKLSVKIVENIGEAIAHINRYSTGHSESIITESYTNSERFLNEIDSACVYVNASTRFTDGFEFGFGAEIGISTQKLHARGPMGLNELTSMKYIIYGDGQIRK